MPWDGKSDWLKGRPKPWRLDMGVLSNKRDGYVGIDIRKTHIVDLVADFRDLAGVRDNSVDAIHSFDSLEHISHNDLVPTLKEWLRVLKPGGEMQIEVPDFDQAIAMWQDGNYRKAWQWIFGSHSFETDYHSLCLNEEVFREILRKVGLVDVQTATPFRGEPKLSVCLVGRKP